MRVGAVVFLGGSSRAKRHARCWGGQRSPASGWEQLHLKEAAKAPGRGRGWEPRGDVRWASDLLHGSTKS